MPNARNILNREEDRRIVEAIREAERNTSGEIKVHIENHCKVEVEERCLTIFNKLEMDKTEQHNGVLIYVAIKDHKLAVMGDQGINDVVDDTFWDDVIAIMVSEFKEDHYADGLEKAILRCGEKLKTYFPYQSDDINEISDEISYGND